MSRVLAFEWRRAASLRSTWGFPLVGMVITLAIAWGDAPDGGATMEGVIRLRGAIGLGLVLITTICAQAFGHEYRDGTMRLVLSQFPHRVQVFLAKLAVPIALVAASILVTLVVAGVGAVLIWGVEPEHGWGTVLAMGSRQVVVAMWWGLMVAAITALVRNLAAGIVVALVFAFVLESLAMGLLLRADETTGELSSRVPWLTENLPFANAMDWADEGMLRPGIVALVWLCVVVGAAGVLFVRRDA